MTQIKIVNAYTVTDSLAAMNNLSISAKWVIYKLRKNLLPYRDFYVQESRKLLDKYKPTVQGNTISFNKPEDAQSYQAEQKEIDSFDVDISIQKQELKLSEIPDISIPQIEQLEDFINFMPE